MYASSDRLSIDADVPPTVTPTGLTFCMQPAHCNDPHQYIKDIIHIIQKFHNAPDPYLTVHHSNCSEWCFMGIWCIIGFVTLLLTLIFCNNMFVPKILCNQFDEIESPCIYWLLWHSALHKTLTKYIFLQITLEFLITCLTKLSHIFSSF